MAVVRMKKDATKPYTEEDFNTLLKRFKNKVAQEGIMQELRKREYYVAPSLKRKLKSDAAEKRRRKKMRGYVEVEY